MDEIKHEHDWKEINNKLVCSICNKNKLLLTNLEDGIKIGKRNNGRSYTVRRNRDRVFSPNEWFAFIKELRDWQVLTFELLMLTGGRIMECQHLRPKDIDFANQRLKFPKTKHTDGDMRKSETRTIRISKYLTDKLKKASEKMLPEEQFGKCKNIACEACKTQSKKNKYKVLSTASANGALKQITKKIGIFDYKMISIHNIRKTSETWSLALGVDSMILSKRFGHNLLTQYQHYSQSDAYTNEEKEQIKKVFGDTYLNL